MANVRYADEFYENAVRAEVSRAIVSKKANVCPFTVRLAWHAVRREPNERETTERSDDGKNRMDCGNLFIHSVSICTIVGVFIHSHNLAHRQSHPSSTTPERHL